MTIMLLPSSPFAAGFGHRFGFAHHHKAWCRRSGATCGPARRFSTRFGTLGGCAKLQQNAGHHATHLSRGEHSLLAFPRTQHRLAKRLGQQQLIASTGYDPTPAFELLRRAQVGVGPEQILLEKAIAMLLGETLAIPGAHLLQGDLLLVDPHEPTLTRVAFAVSSGFPQQADHTNLRLGCLAEMQPTPTRNHDPLTVLIDPLPLGIGWAIGLGTTALKERAMLAGCAALFWLAWGCCPIQLAVALQPDQSASTQLMASARKAGSGIPTIRQQDDPTPDQGQDRAQLLNTHFDGGLVTANATLLQDAHPTTGLLGQEHQRRKLVAPADGFGGMRHIRHIDHATISAAVCFQPLHATPIDAQPDRLICRCVLKQGLHEDRPQALGVDTPILQRFIDAGPATLEEDRQRQFGQATCLWLAEERIAHVEQRIPTALKAAIHLLTQTIQCVKVHVSNAPCDDLLEHYSVRLASARGLSFCFPLV